MALDGDPKIEKEVIEKFRNAGVSCELGDDDLARYGYQSSETNKKLVEYLYRAGDYLTLEGKAWSGWRWSLNKFQTQGLVLREWTGREIPPPDVIAACAFVAGRWKANKCLDPESKPAAWRPHLGSLNLYGDFVKFSPWPCRLMLIESPTHEPLMFTIQQGVPGGCLLLTKYHDSTPEAWGGIDISRLGHLMECRAAAKLNGPETLCNLGAAVGEGEKGVGAAKQNLRPSGVIQVHHLPPHIKLTMDAFRSSNPSKEAPEKTNSESKNLALDFFD